MKFQIGQKVAYLREPGYGKILELKEQQARVEDEHGFDLDNTYDKVYTNPYAPNVVHRINQKSTTDGSIHIEFHETRLDHGDENSTILSRACVNVCKFLI
jgi:hypothetical protein